MAIPCGLHGVLTPLPHFRLAWSVVVTSREGGLYRSSGYRNEALFGADVALRRTRVLRVLPVHKKRAVWAAKQKVKSQAATPGTQHTLLLQVSLLDSWHEE